MDLQPLFNIQKTISLKRDNIPIKQTNKLIILFKSKMIKIAELLLNDANSSYFNHQLYLGCIPLLIAIGIENNWDQKMNIEQYKYQSFSLKSNIQSILEKDFLSYHEYKNIWCHFLAIGNKVGYSVDIQKKYLKLFKITSQGVVFRFEDENILIYGKNSYQDFNMWTKKENLL